MRVGQHHRGWWIFLLIYHNGRLTKKLVTQDMLPKSHMFVIIWLLIYATSLNQRVVQLWFCYNIAYHEIQDELQAHLPICYIVIVCIVWHSIINFCKNQTMCCHYVRWDPPNSHIKFTLFLNKISDYRAWLWDSICELHYPDLLEWNGLGNFETWAIWLSSHST